MPKVMPTLEQKERRKKKYRRANMIRECDAKAKKKRIRIRMAMLIFASVGPFESEARRTNTVTSFDLYP